MIARLAPKRLMAFAAFIASLPAFSVHAETPLERGTYLMSALAACGNCHTQQTPEGPLEGMELAGGMTMVFPGEFTVHVPNITPHAETGVGRWSDEELIRAIREGIRPDGSIIGPPMPIQIYRGISDADARALVAYLRSVPAIENEVPASQYDIPLPPAYGPPLGEVPPVDPADQLAYGAYLAGPVAHCIECHSPPGPNGAPDWEHQTGAGGFTFPGPWGESVGANITPSGLGDWSDQEIKTVVRTGVRPDGSRLLPPMGVHYYANIADSDLDAIIVYLRNLPPL